jgi:hypothetical protein
MARTLSAAGLALPLVTTADGPRIAPGGELDGLAAVVNGFLNGMLPDLRERLRAGAGAARAGVYAREVPAGLDVEEAGCAWHRLTGRQLGADPIMAGSSETGSFTLPRSALLEILDRMLDLRATDAEHAPPEPPSSAAAEPPEDAGPPPATGDGDQRLLARALAQRAGAPGRAEELARLEQRARELDAMDDPAAAAARRRAVLIELDGARVLSGGDDVTRELRDLGLITLIGYHAAAERLRTYLASDERRALQADARPSAVLGAPVSLDWFRRAPEENFERTALGEALLAGAHPEDTVQGRFYTQWQGRWYELTWRRDDGETPALLELTSP